MPDDTKTPFDKLMSDCEHARLTETYVVMTAFEAAKLLVWIRNNIPAEQLPPEA